MQRQRYLDGLAFVSNSIPMGRDVEEEKEEEEGRFLLYTCQIVGELFLEDDDDDFPNYIGSWLVNWRGKS